MFLKTVSLLLGFVFLVSCTGCATILKKKSVDVEINSEPAGADVFIDNNRVGRTPLTINLPHRNPAVVGLKKEGYEDITHTIDNHLVHGWLIVSLLCDGFPAIIDLATKSAFSLNENKINIKLDPKQGNLNNNQNK